jgi:hypothetical protein
MANPGSVQNVSSDSIDDKLQGAGEHSHGFWWNTLAGIVLMHMGYTVPTALRFYVENLELSMEAPIDNEGKVVGVYNSKAEIAGTVFGLVVGGLMDVGELCLAVILMHSRDYGFMAIPCATNAASAVYEGLRYIGHKAADKRRRNYLLRTGPYAPRAGPGGPETG